MALLCFTSSLLEYLLKEEEAENGDSDPHIHLGEDGGVFSRHAALATCGKADFTVSQYSHDFDL